MSLTLAWLLIAQQATTGMLRVTVVDQTNAIVIGATVTVTGADDATKSAVVAPVNTTDAGVAIVPALAPGRYTVEVEFPGFEKRVLSDVRVRAGENRQVAILTIQRMEAAVTVEQDKQQAASDRNGSSFGTTLTRDQIDALSDDPSILQQQLQDMAGPGAVVRIDGFEGGALPAKAMIRSIRIARDQFAAEFHSAGGVAIEIITQPGIGPLRYFSNMLIRDGALSGRSPFVPVKGPEQNVNYGFGFGGTLVENKSSFFVNAFGISAYDTPNLNAAVPGGGTLAHALSMKAPRDNIFVNGQLDYALTLDQTLRFGYNLTHVTNDNLGVGGFDEPDRAYSAHNAVNTFRVQHFGPVGRRAFWRTRVQLIASDSSSVSANDTQTIRVLDSFTSGGAQRAGGDHGRTLNVASDYDYVLGRNSMRAGLVLDSTWYHSDATANYLGTYTYANLSSYPNQPLNYSRRIGDPNIAYDNVQGGLYVQDDIRIRKNLTVTPGVRYELQTHVHTLDNVGPRFGVTWAPAKNGRTTLRGSAGIFYDWLPTSTYDQIVRVDGFHQREINVIDPSFPVAPDNSAVPPANRYLLDPSFATPRISRVSAGIDQALKGARVSITYSYQRGSRLARGENLNAAVAGVRPDQTFANVIDVVSDAASIQHQLQVDANVNPGALLPLNTSAPRIDWKRSTVFFNYTLASLRNNTDGPFSVSPTGTLATEWGPAMGGGGGGGGFIPGVFTFGGGQPTVDVRHRMNASFNNQIVKNLLLALNVNASSAPPYTLLTGLDTNGDGIFNDRPVGVGRGTLRAYGQVTVNTMFGYVFTFGRSTAVRPPGIGVFGQGAAAQVRTVDQGNAKYRLQLYVQTQNLTNERNYVGYSGTLTSPFFGQPTAVGAMRKIDVGMSLSF